MTIDLIDDTALSMVAGAYRLLSDRLAPYRANRPGASPGDILAAVITDWFFRVPPIRVAEARETGGAGHTWMYRFDYPSPAANHGLGACHGVEVPFVFGNVGLAEVSAPYRRHTVAVRCGPGAPGLGGLHHPG